MPKPRTRRLAHVVVLFGIASLLLGALVTPRLAEKYLSADHHITQSGLRALLGYRLLSIAIGTALAATGLVVAKVGFQPIERALEAITIQARNHQGILLALLGFGMVSGVLIPCAPAFQKVPDRDSGLFLYVGRQLLRGGVPYRDIWDHKPPLIHFLNALGLLFTGGSRWGVWIIEFLSLGSAVVLGFILMRRAFGTWSALLGSAVWVGSLPWVLQGGNFTEEFALPLQFAMLYLFWQAETRHQYGWRGLLLGVAGGLCFLLRQNIVGLGVSIALYLVFTRASTRKWSSLLRQLSTACLGAVVVLGVFGVWFGSRGALDELWEAAFEYNFAYVGSTSGLNQRLIALGRGLKTLSPSAIHVAAIAGWFTALRSLTRERRSVHHPVMLCVIALPTELLLSGISGHSYPHYFMTWLPVFAVLSSFLAHSIDNWRLPDHSDSAAEAASMRLPRRRLSRFLLLGMMALPFLKLSSDLMGIFRPVADRSLTDQAVEYAQHNTDPGDYVLVWGAEAFVNFLSDRSSPTRFVYQYPLYEPAYVDAGMMEEFLADIKDNRPAVIIDTSPTNAKIAPLDAGAREIWLDDHEMPPGMAEVLEYLGTSYSQHTRIVLNDSWWSVYVPKERGRQ